MRFNATYCSAIKFRCVTMQHIALQCSFNALQGNILHCNVVSMRCKATNCSAIKFLNSLQCNKFLCDEFSMQHIALQCSFTMHCNATYFSAMNFLMHHIALQCSFNAFQCNILLCNVD